MDLSTAQGIYLGATGVQSVYFGSTLIWPATQHDYSQDYLTFTSLEDNNTIYWKTNDLALAYPIRISTDGGANWSAEFPPSYYDNGQAIVKLNAGEKICIKGNNESYSNNSSTYTHQFKSTGSYNVEGNIMSLIYGDNFINQTSFPANSSYNLEGLFISSKIINAGNLILPATTLTTSCYASLFSRSSSLTTAPVLPATILTQSCYWQMFYNCSSLNYIKCLATDISATACLTRWVDGVAASGTFIKDASTTWPTGNNGIPSGWTVENAA